MHTNTFIHNILQKYIFSQPSKDHADTSETYIDCHNVNDPTPPPPHIPDSCNVSSGDNSVRDSMHLVSQAIDTWARLYNMENLSKKVVFQQALSIMAAMNELLFED
ncbi:MAG: hypothetical protein J6I64_09570 [Lachnospiraceae bacterium]|nr:hypothetical protein [Lachnospiraceae bacterium]